MFRNILMKEVSSLHQRHYSEKGAAILTTSGKFVEPLPGDGQISIFKLVESIEAEPNRTHLIHG